MISPAVQDYLKAIYKLQKQDEKVSTSAIAERLELSNATVTAMIKKLAEKKLLKHTSYHGVVLTDEGRKTALEVIRRHRLVELFLKEILGLPWDKIHAEAEKLEHVISDELLERIDSILGHPKTDPHGNHIPTKDGMMPDSQDNCPLVDVEVGETVVINSVSDSNPDKLQFMSKLGLFPGVVIHISDKPPFEGDLFIKVGSTEHRLPREVAKNIFVLNEVEAR
ncbi:MAG TPA: metal-dependent transcriptional regulator [Thermodesulfobacteriota bacterium]|nr:metal-dependent transcriptional regulator [Thermodesulfobacteriota bacterium]